MPFSAQGLEGSEPAGVDKKLDIYYVWRSWRGSTPVFSPGFESLATVSLYLTDKNKFGALFRAEWQSIAWQIQNANINTKTCDTA